MRGLPPPGGKSPARGRRGKADSETRFASNDNQARPQAYVHERTDTLAYLYFPFLFFPFLLLKQQLAELSAIRYYETVR